MTGVEALFKERRFFRYTERFCCTLQNCCNLRKTKTVTLAVRLAAIDGDDGYTGVKPQHRYVTCPPWHRRLDFFL